MPETLLRRSGLLAQRVDQVKGVHWQIAGQAIFNFASTNYLGLQQHPAILQAASAAMQTWGISLGTPSLLAEPVLVQRLETALALLVDRPAALLFPSTTHAALDLIPTLAGSAGIIFIDAWAYPISWQGVVLAVHRGARVVQFAHNDPVSLESKMKRFSGTNRRKVIICDGVYPAGGEPAPLLAFDSLARRYHAWIYVDDAHGLGVLGAQPGPYTPVGLGGGGTPVFCGVSPGRLIHVASLSKAFGIPFAFAAGPAALIDHLRPAGKSREHSSPPAPPLLAAGIAALSVHTRDGDALRNRLLAAARRFRLGLAKAGILLSPTRFPPVQTLLFDTPTDALKRGQLLRQCGVWALIQLQPPERPSGSALRFVLSSTHDSQELDEAIDITISVLEKGGK